MPRNIEIKSRVADFPALKQRAADVSDTEVTVLSQEDIFFHAPEGRLKLRIFDETKGQLIFYRRDDQSGPKLSSYHITELVNPLDLKTTLSLALGVKGSVKKIRYLYFKGQTRIHLDVVENLGTFMELEVVLRDDQTVEEGDLIAKDLMSELKILQTDLMTGAYVDLLANG